MKKLENVQMEKITGGKWSFTSGCVFGVLGIVGLGLAIAAVPATGGLAAGVVAGVLIDAAGTGWSIGSCIAG